MNNNEIISINKRDNFLVSKSEEKDLISVWFDLYFEVEVTTVKKSIEVQKRDLKLFIKFMIDEKGSDLRKIWTPKLSQDFKHYLSTLLDSYGSRRWGDKTVNRILAHLKTFAKWINKIAEFPLGNPMEKIKNKPLGNNLEIDRAITKTEREIILEFADLLIQNNGKKSIKTRCYRNRAILYTLIETGMRREAVTQINIDNIDFNSSVISVVEKGGITQPYSISSLGLNTIKDYIDKERESDFEKWKSPALFLSSNSIAKGNGRLAPQMINVIWNKVCESTNIKNRTPHSARHAMGLYIMEKTGNVAAVQKQLGHKNPMMSMQYLRVTNKDMKDILDGR
ncbi:MAG: tyrosine-type recombinase/integrase [Desulfobacterales bacterium]|nr:tyrosine-type recombinase/integrase [Desulfobacterales bacterium]